MEYENWVRKWARWCDIGTFFRQGKLRQGGVVVDRDCILGLAASDTQEKLFKKLLKFLIIDETYNDSSSIDWNRYVHAYAAIRVKIWWIINTHALPSKGHLAWCPAQNYDSRFYTLIHHNYAIGRPYNNHLEWDNTLALVCTTLCNHIFLYWYHIAMCLKY